MHVATYPRCNFLWIDGMEVCSVYDQYWSINIKRLILPVLYALYEVGFVTLDCPTVSMPRMPIGVLTLKEAVCQGIYISLADQLNNSTAVLFLPVFKFFVRQLWRVITLKYYRC